MGRGGKAVLRAWVMLGKALQRANHLHATGRMLALRAPEEEMKYCLHGNERMTSNAEDHMLSVSRLF